jgi:two-component system sensor histidine kinase BaeS
MNSIIYRITGLMFLTVALTVFVLIYLANRQMTSSFQEYLVVQHMEVGRQALFVYPSKMVMMGPSEENFLASFHQSLIWVGMGILGAGLIASYLLARSIAVPLRNLSRAAEQIEQGNFEQQVPVETKDEVGHLATIFNQMAQTLAKSNRLRRELLANIAHELRTPLAIIQGNLEGMMDGVVETSKEQLGSLHEEAIRLNRLIKELKDLSLAEVRQLTLEKSLVEINHLMSRAVALLRPMAEEKEIEIVCTLQSGLPEIMADADRISQIFYNIITNAIRYTPNQGRIEVSTLIVEQKRKASILLSIRDNGPGISEEDLPYVFDHFYRGEKSRDRKSGGTGLGLAIVKELVEIHGGHITVESRVGAGTVFHVLLPVEE